ncbi:Bcr/CflA family drug resistance efflux transporter [Acidocella aquatica]|uniref:Bcr/CflA family drug resistance efflux transporter n=2 Tax=Acidocella aquatica TaxID=1922313 RepID=A0ABQ6A3S3_9PROT|nr:Bcr/CflA family drug resistance efflux transporter [Acidocella aquatica]
MGFREFVACIALVQACVALAIDMMVPALGQIGAAMRLPVANERQWVITAFVLGFGAAQLLYGVAADRFGRRPVLLFALGLYAFCAFAAAAAPNFSWLLAARVAQGFGAAGAQVATVSIVRDCYSGRRMAQVNSLSFIVFLAAPIFAPSLGQLVLLLAPWPVIFIGLGLYAMLIATWAGLRLPETQHPQDRRPIIWHEAAAALRLTLRNRMSLGYTLASTLLLGGWLGFINSAQQVFAGVFHVPKLFPLIFAACSICMAVAALANARLVERIGMRKLAHLALSGFVLMAFAQAGLALSGQDTLLRFALLQSAMMFWFGLLGGNCGAIAMEPLGHIAGTAASVQGFIVMLGAALIGLYIGQNFNGTLIPLCLGFCVCGILGLAVAAWAERGRLFHARPVAVSLPPD